MYQHENNEHISRLRDLREEDHVQRKQKSNSSSGNLPISQPGDTSENEADSIAKKVTDGEHVSLNSTTNAATISTKSEAGNISSSPEFTSQLIQTKGTGQSMDESTLSEMESKMGTDFSSVKMHTDSNAQNMSSDINAKAFTHGQDIYFGSGNYNPQSKDGKELLAHELVHTKQQNNMVQPMIQRVRDDDKYGMIPNQGNTSLTGQDAGAMGYLPNATDFGESVIAQNDDERVNTIDKFVIDFWDAYVEVSTKDYDILLSMLDIEAKGQDADATGSARGIYISGASTISGYRTDTYADWGHFKTSSTGKESGFSSMIALPPSAYTEPLLAALQLRKTDEPGYKEQLKALIINDVDTKKIQALMTSLRDISTQVNRVDAALKASEASGLPLADVLTLYGQEGYYTMPASSTSLSQNVPVTENAGKSITSMSIGGDNYKYDLVSMNLVVRQKSELWSTKYLKTDKDRRLQALTAFCVQIAGLEVTGSAQAGYTAGYEKNLAALAKWSAKNRAISINDPSFPQTEKAKDAVQTRKDWDEALDNITESSPPHRSGRTDLDAVWLFAPLNSVKLVSFILTEASILLKAYQNQPQTTEWFGAKGKDLQLPTPVAYLMYNATGTSSDSGMQSLISQAAWHAKDLATNPISYPPERHSTLDGQPITELDSLNMTSDEDFAAVKAWIMVSGKEKIRWDLLMHFLQHAGQDEWDKTWLKVETEESKKARADAKTNGLPIPAKKYRKDETKFVKRINSSNFRTLSEFYQGILPKK